MAFLDDNYLLTNPTAHKLFNGVKDLPFIDPHNHADVEEIVKNNNYTDIWQVEAATDHYVWELLRKRGVPEDLITGTAANRDKWLALAGVFPELIGNPTYEWIHLDLKRRLGIDEPISKETGETIWERSKEILAGPDMRPQSLMKSMNVETICSTDDPVDSLQHHQTLNSGETVGMVRPTFRPDKAMTIFKPDWPDYIARLEKRVNTTFKSVKDLIAGLESTHDYFAENGCVASDHGVEVPYAYPVDEQDADAAFKKARQGKQLTEDDMITFMSFVLTECARMDAKKGWVFQVHIGAVRDIRDTLSENLGPDSGGDISDHMIDIVAPLSPLLNRFDNKLKVILYTLDPTHYPTVASLCRAFGQHVNLGSAWWLNDSPIGMRRQLEYIGTVDLLANFAGMVSDSRKLLSYGSRNEMFRRTLCDTVGQLVERGQAPLPAAMDLVKQICYKRPKELFGV
ncbi:MAG: glucuronate isomerase [Candidatus Pacebacteria bacterium]|nr:glucuronate isomerase [Candidatus Paceibacterota bacterium]